MHSLSLQAIANQQISQQTPKRKLRSWWEGEIKPSSGTKISWQLTAFVQYRNFCNYEQQSDLLSNRCADVSQSQPNVLCEHAPFSVLSYVFPTMWDWKCWREGLPEQHNTVLPLSIRTLCEPHRHVDSSNDIIFCIRRLHLKHRDLTHAVASNLTTISFCIPP